jgi:hypothetical protein
MFASLLSYIDTIKETTKFYLQLLKILEMTKIVGAKCVDEVFL